MRIWVVWIWDYEWYKFETDKYEYLTMNSMDLRLWMVYICKADINKYESETEWYRFETITFNYYRVEAKEPVQSVTTVMMVYLLNN